MKITAKKVYDNEKTWGIKGDDGQIYSYFKKLRDGSRMPVSVEGVTYEVSYRTSRHPAIAPGHRR